MDEELGYDDLAETVEKTGSRTQRYKHRLGNLPYAVIGLVAHRPEGAHGYQLKQELESICEESAQLTYGRLYATLDLLAREGKLHLAECIQSGRPNRKVYRATEAGLDYLGQWLLTPISEDPRPLRDELSLKILFLDRKNVAAMAELVEQQRSKCLERLSRLVRRRKRLERAKLSPAAIDVILQGPKLHVRADLAWLKEVESTHSLGDLRTSPG
jgi:DNA-binding PadR family transcriptional regulator